MFCFFSFFYFDLIKTAPYYCNFFNRFFVRQIKLDHGRLKATLLSFRRKIIHQQMDWEQVIEGLKEDYPFAVMVKLNQFLMHTDYDSFDVDDHQFITKKILPLILQLLRDNSYDFNFLFDGYSRDISKDLTYPIPHDLIAKIDASAEIQCIDERLQQQGRSILVAITAGTYKATESVVKQGGIPILIDGLQAVQSLEVKSNSIQALGNIASNITGEDMKCRDMVLQANVLDELLNITRNGQHDINLSETTQKCWGNLLIHGYFGQIYNNNKSVRVMIQDIAPILLKYYLQVSPARQLLKCIAYTIGSLVHGKPSPEYDYAAKAIEIFNTLKDINDEGIMKDMIWAISHISNTQNIQLRDSLYSNGLMAKCIRMLSCELDDDSLLALFNIMANVTRNPGPTHVQKLIDCGALQKLKEIMHLTHISNHMKYLFCRVIYNVAQNSQQLPELIDNGLIEILLMSLLHTEKSYITKKAMSAIVQVICFDSHSECTLEQTQVNIFQHLIKFMRECKTEQDLMILLYGIDDIMRCGWFAAKDTYSSIFVKCGGIELLTELLRKECDIVTSKVKQRIRDIQRLWFDNEDIHNEDR